MANDILKFIPGTDAFNREKQAESVKRNAAMEILQAMRQASTTGGALGQTPVQQRRGSSRTGGALGQIPESQLNQTSVEDLLANLLPTGGALGQIPISQQDKFGQDPIFALLQLMREASPTGGSRGRR